MKITKSQLMDIIRTEVYFPGDHRTIAQKSDNRVKTNGIHRVKRYDLIEAIARKLYKTERREEIIGRADILTDGVGMAKDPLKLIKARNYFGALSAEFENVSYEFDLENPRTPVPQWIKEHAALFVEMHFPDIIVVPDFNYDVLGNKYDMKAANET